MRSEDSLHICVTRRQQEQFLKQELTLRLPGVQCNELAPQVIALADISLEELVRFPLFLSSQLLPNAASIEAQSISAWTNTILSHLREHFGDTVSPWSIHIFEPLSAETGETYARPELIKQELRLLLKQKRRSLMRSLHETCAPECALAQVLMTSKTSGFISIASPSQRSACKATVSPHEAGFCVIPDDKNPPSRAFKKLREAITIFGLSIARDSVAVDLGASPGGWTHVLVDHGATVTAIDRSPLEGAIARSSRATFTQGNAFTWTPSQTVDWLVCDVITTPDRTFEILRRWIGTGLCRNFCVTVKFKGDPDAGALCAIGNFLSGHTSWWDGRQLTHNKNEVTVVGRL
jgi:23S rRNA C2498 (ribose-2'-O)-methylase RlmM